MTELIWYNPDLDVYEKGDMRDYDRLLLTSLNSDRFDILYEFSDTSRRLIDKILNSLNTARRMKLEAALA